jgi:hypothetical protein
MHDLNANNIDLMKVYVLCVIGILAGIRVFAGSFLPSDVAKAAVQAAHDNHLQHFLALVDVVSIHGQKEQPRLPEETMRLLAAINPKDLRLDDPRGGGYPGARVEVSATLPMPLKFIVSCIGRPAGEPQYKIIGIYAEEQRSTPQGGANGRPPTGSETNRSSAAAASRRSP